MKPLLTVLGALALGAGAMYYFDPDQGRRRRALVADKAGSAAHDTRDYFDRQRKRGADRLQGLASRIRSRLASPPPTDAQLSGQVRARLGRAVSYPRAIETEVQQGRVILRGDVLADEFNLLMAEIWSLPGVAAVDSQLALHAEPANVPVFAGKPRRITRARMRSLARGSASTLALAGSAGSLVRALRVEGLAPRAGLLSLAAALLAYGMGGSLRRLMAQPGHGERIAPAGQRMGPTETRGAEVPVQYPAEPTPEGAPAVLNPNPTPSLH